MATDIVPELLENIQRDFNTEISRNAKLQQIREMIESGTATYEQAYDYAEQVGKALTKSFETHISSSVLPDGHMYFNIAERILNTTLENNHIIIATVSAEIQEILNKQAGLGLKGIQAELNQHRIDSIVNRITEEENFDDVDWILQEPIINFSQSVVDDTLKENVKFQGESGLFPKIIRRTTASDACDWCKEMEGTYKYPKVPDGVFGRHDRCRCTVEYDPGDARRQNVWSKEWS